MEPTRMQIAYDRLRAKMLSGELAPGTRLVNRALGEELGVSTVTVREALHRLASEGLVEHVPNAGAYVRTLDRRQVAELYRFRSALESFALEEAVRRADDHALDRLDELCGRMRALCDRARQAPSRTIDGALHDAWLQTDLDFHHEIATAAANRWLTKTQRELGLAGRIAATKQRSLELGPAARTWRFHHEIARALRARDLPRAQTWLRRHDEYGLARALRAAAGHGDPR